MAAAVAAARRTERSWSEELARVFGTVDALALPTLAGDPPPIGRASLMAQLRYSAPFNLSGHPAISLPVLTPGGGPVPASLQLAARPGGEDLLIATAAVVEDTGAARTPA